MCIELVVGTNTYATLEEASAFMNERWFLNIWTAVSGDEAKKRFLISAYDSLKRLRYADAPTTGSDTLVAETWIIEAQCLEALALVVLTTDDDFQTRLSLQMQGMDRLTIDKIHEEYKRRKTIGGLYSVEAFETISPHLLRAVTRLITDY